MVKIIDPSRSDPGEIIFKYFFENKFSTQLNQKRKIKFYLKQFLSSDYKQ